MTLGISKFRKVLKIFAKFGGLVLGRRSLPILGTLRLAQKEREALFLRAAQMT